MIEKYQNFHLRSHLHLNLYTLKVLKFPEVSNNLKNKMLVVYSKTDFHSWKETSLSVICVLFVQSLGS